MEKELKCKECHWYQTNNPKIKCGNIPMDDWEPLGKEFCKEFVLTKDYVPEWGLSVLMKKIDDVVLKENS